METVPLRLRPLSRMATTSLGVPARSPPSMAAAPRLNRLPPILLPPILLPPILLPCLPALRLVFPATAAAFRRRLPA